MLDAEVLRRATNLPPKVLEHHELHCELASRLPTSLPPRALALMQLQQRRGPAPKQEWGQTDSYMPSSEDALTRAASPSKPIAPPTTPEPQLELPMLRTTSSGDEPAAVCPPSMQPLTPHALCKPLSTDPREPARSGCKAPAAPAAAVGPAKAPARPLLLALALQLLLLPLLLASLSAALGGPAEAPDASLGSIRTWGIAGSCSASATLLLLCSHAGHAQLGWRVGMTLDALILVLRAGACRSLALVLPSAAVLLVCRILLSGCALARPAGADQAPEGARRGSPNLHVQLWHKA